MTNGEAARKLFDIKHDEHFSWTQESVDAFDLAISALFDLSVSSLEKHPDESSGTRKRPKWVNSIRDALLYPNQSTLKMPPDIPATGTPEECDDAVSRTDVISLYKRGAERIARVTGVSMEELPHNGLDMLMKLPPVTPKSQIGELVVEECEDAVSRKRLLEEFCDDELEWDTFCGYIAPHIVRKVINELPPVTPKPKVGKWIFQSPPDDWVMSLYKCDQCGHIEEGKPNFCPNCGAKMG